MCIRDSCVAARAQDAQHRHQPEREESWPVIECDYTYDTAGVEPGTEDSAAATIFTAVDKDTGYVFQVFVQRKGANPYAAKAFANWLEDLGHERMVVQSDGENSLIKLVQLTQKLCPR
eukprot:13590479-Alexandrium_andersonii.AAC.1